MRVHLVTGGAPSLAVRVALKYLEVPYDLIDVNYGAGDHTTEEYKKLNPQKEIPVLDDDGFFLSESNAILQYICDKFKPDSNAYPKDPKMRAIVNHRLCFNLSTYYRHICEYSMDPIFYDYQRTPLGLKKTHVALNVFNAYLERSGTKYAAADNLTIADFPLVTSTMCLEAIAFDFSAYKLISKWYSAFKTEYPDLWDIIEIEMKVLMELERNPPDLSSLVHPFQSFRKGAK